MSGLNTKRLVLVRATRKSSSNEKTHRHGTGYFVTKDLVLTAGHILSSKPSEIKVRLENPQEGKDPWLKAELIPVWVDQKIDAALLKVERPILGEVNLPWAKTSFKETEEWNSVAYPVAAAEKTDENGKAYKSIGLKGTLYVYGGGGQGRQELDLGVEHESKDQWNGISGAPIFVGDKLVGIIKSYETGFSGKRLIGVPVEKLLIDPAFRLALGPRWLSPFPQKPWILILSSENDEEEFSDIVKTAIERKVGTINRAHGLPLKTAPRYVEALVTEALKDPTRWYEIVQTLCAAPIMVVDVTNFQPAIMLLLGIRAVVRRGVTIAVTSNELDESLLSEFPFNIQETKLIYPLPNIEVADPRHPIKRIGEAIVRGLEQVQELPGYLDLPVYEAIRCPKPRVVSTDVDNQAKVIKDAQMAEFERILMLCSFNKLYKNHWRYVSEKIISTFREVGKSLERMIDISSPRLVGQALYESIRWTPCCIVDWTHWRPNVFFELGVRLACSDIGPVLLIDEEEISALKRGTYSVQKEQLLKLFQPITYKLSGTSAPFKDAYKRYDSCLSNEETIPKPYSAIPHNSTYQTVVKAYDWRQEVSARPPHEELRVNVETQQGKDPELDGYQALFSANFEFKQEIQQNGLERWIAAWCYFRKRYVPEDLESEEFKNNREIREQLSVLTERVVQELRNQADHHHQRIYKEAVELIDKLDEL